MQYFRVPMSVVNDWNTVPEECFLKGDYAFLSTVSSLVTLDVAQSTQLLLWVARPLPEEGQVEVRSHTFTLTYTHARSRCVQELSNWIAYQSLSEQQDDDPENYDSELLQCPCLPDLRVNQCPPVM